MIYRAVYVKIRNNSNNFRLVTGVRKKYKGPIPRKRRFQTSTGVGINRRVARSLRSVTI